jgi:hypothetical protein
MYRFFEVKTGKNKGFYVVVKKGNKEAFSNVFKSWGYLDPIEHYNFYKKHGVKPGLVIYTHSGFASKEFWMGQYFKAFGLA